jgi:hypothetical protein
VHINVINQIYNPARNVMRALHQVGNHNHIADTFAAIGALPT